MKGLIIQTLSEYNFGTSTNIKIMSAQTLTFVELAEKEHDALSAYCNVLSSLSHAINHQKSKLLNHPSGSGLLDPLRFMPQERKEESALVDYMTTLRNLQLCHSKLVQCFQEMTMNVNEEVKANQNQTQSEILTRHIDVSKRALTTCASSTSRGFGPLHENGLIKNLTGNGDDDWHEIRVVTLVSLRASIAKVRKDLEPFI